MALVKIYSDKNSQVCKTLESFTEIQDELKKINIAIERWQPKSQLGLEASQEEVLGAYAGQVAEVMTKYGFSSVDVISMNATVPEERIEQLRRKFLDEHIHSDDEVRYFIEGEGLFCIHAGEQVVQILCGAGDFIAVPAHTKHWFDMGTKPNFKCIRFFGDERGWIAEYTGDEIAQQFPVLDQLNAERSTLKV